MAKITLNKPTSGYNLAAINDNFTKIEAEFQDKVLYRNNPLGETNVVETSVDMNSKRLYNLSPPQGPNDALRLADVPTTPIGATTALLTSFTPTPSISATNVQAAIEQSGQINLRNDLATASNALKGANLVAFTPTGIGATPTTLQTALNIFDQKPSGQFFADFGSKINRLADRVFVGEAIVSDGKLTNTVNSWLEDMRNNSLRAAQMAVTSTIGQGGIVGGSRTSESAGVGSQGCIGVSGYSNNNNATQLQSSYAGYFESRRQIGAGITHAAEFDIVNLGTTIASYPSLLAPQGISNGLWVASGGEVVGATPASTAIAILNNGTTFEKGIIFQVNALNMSGGEGAAMAMAAGHALVWYDTGVNKVARIRCDATAQSLGMIFANSSLVLQTIAGASLFNFGVDSSLTMGTGLRLAMPTLNFSGFTTTGTATAGTASALPANPVTYLQVQVNGTNVKIPTYLP